MWFTKQMSLWVGVTFVLPWALGCAPKTPKDRIVKIDAVVRATQRDASRALVKAGLPDAPRAVDLLTGGNWGVGIDLGQAMNKGYPPSCQIVYEQTCQSLRGMVSHYSESLGVGMPPELVLKGLDRGGILVHQGREAQIAVAKASLTPEKREALVTARSLFAKALIQVSALGPFDKPSNLSGPSMPHRSKEETKPDSPLTSNVPTEPPSVLVGSYGLRQDGRIVDFFRVKSENGKYLLDVKLQGKWTREKNPLQPMDVKGFQNATNTKSRDFIAGLGSSDLALLKVPPGWQDGGLSTSTGYLAIMMIFGGTEVVRLDGRTPK